MNKIGFIFLVLVSVTISHAQSFKVEGTQIIDPEGNEFIIKGVNVNGPHWPWGRSTVADADLITEAWKFNTIRVNCFPSLAGTFPNNNADLDAIVNTFTARDVVTIIEDHDFTGKYPTVAELEDLVDWWTDKANRFKNNTYVWFNIANEPGGGGVAPEIWKTFHETVIQAIRGTGAENIIVLDGHAFGQENGYASADESAIQTFGPYFISNYENIAFSLHLYSSWIYGKQRLKDFIDDAHDKNLSIHIGEYGTADSYSKGVAAEMFEVVLPENIGRIAWQWDGTDVHELTSAANGGGWEINKTNGDKPTNLSFVGNLVWADNHEDLILGSEDFKVPGPWLVNGSFEEDLNEWIAFGNQALETSSAQAQSGSKAFRINSGESGGAVQPIYLIPDTEYVLTAWGKSSAAAPGGDIGVQYDTDGGQVQHVVNFTETTYRRKEVEFKTPESLSDASVFIYRSVGATTFHADNINIRLKSDVVTGTEQGNGKESLLVYPNPAKESIRIHVPDGSRRIVNIRMSDVLGRNVSPVVQTITRYDRQLETTGLHQGVYILTIDLGDQIISRKITILK